MTAVLNRRPGPAGGAPPPRRSRRGLEALRDSRAALAVTGLLLACVTVGLVYVIWLTFTGHFTNVVTVEAQLPPGGNALQVASPVEYRNVTVGKVGSETPGPGGVVDLELLIYPKNLVLIPSGVQARISPLSIFGNQYVNLVPPPLPSPGHLEAGDTITPYTGAPSSSLQGTVTQLYDLLDAIHPGQLDTALTAFATALNGEGAALGHALSGSANYLGQAVVPNLGTIQSDLQLLQPVSAELNASAPDVLGTLRHSAITAATITQQEAALRSLLDSGTAAAGQLGDLLQHVQVSLPQLLNESGPLLADITQSPTELSRTLSGLTQFASAVAASEMNGPYMSVTATLPIADVSAGVNAALGYDNPASIDAALGAAMNPPTYTSANCPEYPGETNPYCGSGGSPDATPVPDPYLSANGAGQAAPGAATPAGIAGTPAQAARPQGATTQPSNPTDAMVAAASGRPYQAELQSLQAIAAALNGGKPVPAPGLADVVLLPILSSMAAHG